MSEESYHYDVLDGINERWPGTEDRLFVSSRAFTPAQSPDERLYRLTRGYKRAGDLLVEKALGNPADQRNLIYPIVFCYRHYIQLALKGVIEDHGPVLGIYHGKDHNLKELWELFEKICQAHSRGDSDGLATVAACIHELAEVDSGSFSFRYARTKKGEPITLPKDGFDLITLHDVMNGIENFFECADLDFSEKGYSQ